MLCNLFASLALAFLVQARPDTTKPGAPDLGPMRTIEFDTDEGTWMNIDLSPAGKTILFDLLGDIYTLPIEGGEAKPLLTGRASEHMAPDSAPGKQVAVSRDLRGPMNMVGP